MKQFFFRTLLMSVLLLVPVISCASEVSDRIVAVVNGEIITLFEINERIKPVLTQFQGRELTLEEKRAVLEMRTQLVDSMVENLLLKQEAERLGVEVADTEVENQVETLKRSNGLSEDDFVQRLKMEGTSREEFTTAMKQDIIKQRLLSFMVRRKVVITDEEIQDYFDANSETFQQDKQVDLALILLPEGASVLTLKARIEKGEISFEEAADTMSQGPGVGQGGKLGSLAWDDLADGWKQAMTDVPEGGITKPFNIQGRPALLKVLSYSGGDVVFDDAVKEQIRAKLFEEEMGQLFDEYMDKLKADAVIDIKL